jgi:hypothetical protein
LNQGRAGRERIAAAWRASNRPFHRSRNNRADPYPEQCNEAIAELRSFATLPFDPSAKQGFVDFCRGNARLYLCIVRTARNPMLENIVMSALDISPRPTYPRIVHPHDFEPTPINIIAASSASHHLPAFLPGEQALYFLRHAAWSSRARSTAAAFCGS